MKENRRLRPEIYLVALFSLGPQGLAEAATRHCWADAQTKITYQRSNGSRFTEEPSALRFSFKTSGGGTARNASRRARDRMRSCRDAYFTHNGSRAGDLDACNSGQDNENLAAVIGNDTWTKILAPKVCVPSHRSPELQVVSAVVDVNSGCADNKSFTYQFNGTSTGVSRYTAQSWCKSNASGPFAAAFDQDGDGVYQDPFSPATSHDWCPGGEPYVSVPSTPHNHGGFLRCTANSSSSGSFQIGELDQAIIFQSLGQGRFRTAFRPFGSFGSSNCSYRSDGTTYDYEQILHPVSGALIGLRNMQGGFSICADPNGGISIQNSCPTNGVAFSIRAIDRAPPPGCF